MKPSLGLMTMQLGTARNPTFCGRCDWFLICTTVLYDCKAKTFRGIRSAKHEGGSAVTDCWSLPHLACKAVTKRDLVL